MSHYLDQSFCTASTDGTCLNTKCRRSFTDEHEAAAEKWWGGPGAPVAMGDFSKGCADIQEPVCGICCSTYSRCTCAKDSRR